MCFVSLLFIDELTYVLDTLISKWFVLWWLISEERFYHHIIHFLLSSELFGLRGEVEDYYYLNQGGAHMKDGNDDNKDNSKNYSKDYTATKVRDMLVEFNLF